LALAALELELSVYTIVARTAQLGLGPETK